MNQVKTKSNAPWILGILGLFPTILHLCCAVLCAAAAVVGTEGAKLDSSIMRAKADAVSSMANAADKLAGLAESKGVDGAKSGVKNHSDAARKSADEDRKMAAEFDQAADTSRDVVIYTAYGTCAILLICFILSFFGKSGISLFTGLFLIIGGLTAAGLSVVYLSIGGLIAGFIYACSGISSICNAKRPKAA